MFTSPKKLFLVIIALFIVMFFFLLIKHSQLNHGPYSFTRSTLGEVISTIPSIPSVNFEDYAQGKWRGFSSKQVAKLSKLGEILYLDDTPPVINSTLKNYTILIWKYGPSIERRHIYHFTKQRFDPFENCSVKNCRLTYKDEDIKEADLVVFHLHRTKGVDTLPKERNPQQIWTFLTDESPYHTFMSSKNNSMKHYNGLFNWSMTYRMDSDIAVPYGRTVALKNGEKGTKEQIGAWITSKKQDVLIAIMGSNCGGHNHRWQYVKELKKYIPVDMYGGCGTLKCPGHFAKDCDEISKYKFYLSFENSNCDEYITEKLWWNGFAKNAIPIVMGSSKTSYRQLLPPNSYINIENFASPRDLANYISYLNNTPSEMEKYLEWKKYFKVLNEHGYFQTNSVHYCRICEALNYNSKEEKVYNDLQQFWNKESCHASWDAIG